MKHTHYFTPSGPTTQILAAIRRPINGERWLGTLLAFGTTFGTGSLALNLSPDGGMTLIPIKDSAGNAVVLTANGAYDIELGWPEPGGTGRLSLYGVLTGATNPNFEVDVYDNVG